MVKEDLTNNTVQTKDLTITGDGGVFTKTVNSSEDEFDSEK